MFKVIIAFFFEFVNSLASQSIVFHTFVTTKISAVAFLPSDVYKNGKPRILVYHAAYFRSKMPAACHIRLFCRCCLGSFNITLIGIELFGCSAEDDIIYLYPVVLFISARESRREKYSLNAS